jgi:hypothetical protein
MSAPRVRVAIVNSDVSTQERFVNWLREREVYDPVPMTLQEAADADWKDVSIVIFDWDVDVEIRTAIVSTIENTAPSTGILAVFEGVPESDPLVSGADHAIQMPTDSEVFITELRVVALQQRYDQEFTDLARTIARAKGEEDADIDRAIAEADETLEELSNHLSFVDLFRRLIDERGGRPTWSAGAIENTYWIERP